MPRREAGHDSDQVHTSSLSDDRAVPLVERLENVRPVQAKADLKNLETPWREQIGRAIERCFSLAGLSQKEAAGLLDRDQAQVARWIAATERPQFDTIFSVDRFRQPLVQALSELAGADVEIVVRLRRTA